ncbi:MAG: hypothetical protein U9P63_01585 [Patescibacteria group bacterium]|nr:hypothetical protein [Patescibacteria group bacterium]
MELEEFIKKTLVSIASGLKSTNEELKKSYKSDKITYMIEPSIWHRDKNSERGFISFDVAVTVSKESKKSGKGGLKIYVADLGGEKGSKISENSVSRIKFYIAVDHTIG